MQVAWMQASMMAQMVWPLPHEYAGEEDADCAEQEGYRQIDIIGALARVSSAGLDVVAKATLAADCLRVQ